VSCRPARVYTSAAKLNIVETRKGAFCLSSAWLGQKILSGQMMKTA
jgi:hypothetical protein